MRSRSYFEMMWCVAILRKRAFVLASAIIISCVMTGCGLVKIDTSRFSSIPADPDIVFIDLDTFDASLSQNMRAKTAVVSVSFPNQAVSINDMPERLQRWLSAIHNHGGGVKVETEDGFARKDLMTIVAAMSAGYQLAKRYLPVVMGRKYKAVIVLASTKGEISKVEFQRL